MVFWSLVNGLWSLVNGLQSVVIWSLVPGQRSWVGGRWTSDQTRDQRPMTSNHIWECNTKTASSSQSGPVGFEFRDRGLVQTRDARSHRRDGLQCRGMDRRNFLKRALGVIGVGPLAGSVEPAQEPTTPAIEAGDNSAIYAAWPSGWVHMGSTDDAIWNSEPLPDGVGWVIPDHTHDIPLHPSPFALSDDAVSLRDALMSRRIV